MKAKIPKHIKEIILQITPEKGMVVKYVQEKPIKIFNKAVPVNSEKKNSSDELIYFNIAGTVHHVKSETLFKKLRTLEDCCECMIKHEWKNKYDDHACAIYCKKIKLGFIPRDLNKQFIAKALKRIKYKFYVCNLKTFDFDDSEFGGPLVIAVRQR